MLSAAIPTYGRTEGVARAVASLLQNPEVGEVLLIDQNDDDRLESVVASLDDARLHHVRTDHRGAGRARNLALETARGDVLCLIDDDCDADAAWVATMTEATLASDGIGLTFSTVLAPADAEGFTPARIFTDDRTHHTWGRRPTTLELGIGAAYAVRVSAARAIGGWDERLGPGGDYPSADDIDLAFRMLLAGWAVRCTPATSVVHHGTRPLGPELRELNKRDYRAAGAMYAKLIRVRPRAAIPATLQFLGTAVADSLRDSLRSRRPAGVGRWVWTLVGLAQGARHPLDRATARFEVR